MNNPIHLNQPPAAASPHAHDRSSVERIMLQVCLALLPTTLFGLYLFGYPAMLLFAVTCISAVATEALCLSMQGHSLARLSDSSALLTGWLLALSLPPWAPWWIGAGGSFFAVAIGKHLYGGLGQNVFNPAMLARVALLISFPVQMTTWANVTPLGSDLAPGFMDSLGITFGFQPVPDGYTSATTLGQSKAAASAHQAIDGLIANDFALPPALLGLSRGSLGETSELLVLLGGLWLLRTRIISWHIPVAMLATTALVATFFYHLNPARYMDPLTHLSSGGIALGAFFIATDYVTSPSTNQGKLLFGMGCGLVLYAIRTWGGFPEAVGFAVLFMNALTPLIDRSIKPRAYGRNLQGKAVQLRVSARKVN